MIDEVGRGAGLTLAFRSGHLDRDSYDIAGLTRLGVLLQLNVSFSRLHFVSSFSVVRKQRGALGLSVSGFRVFKKKWENSERPDSNRGGRWVRLRPSAIPAIAWILTVGVICNQRA